MTMFLKGDKVIPKEDSKTFKRSHPGTIQMQSRDDKNLWSVRFSCRCGCGGAEDTRFFSADQLELVDKTLSSVFEAEFVGLGMPRIVQHFRAADQESAAKFADGYRLGTAKDVNGYVLADYIPCKGKEDNVIITYVKVMD